MKSLDSKSSHNDSPKGMGIFSVLIQCCQPIICNSSWALRDLYLLLQRLLQRVKLFLFFDIIIFLRCSLLSVPLENQKILKI